MIEKVSVNGFGCVQSLALGLTPLHALIGPNDSGKSTILRAIATIAHLAVGPRAPVLDAPVADQDAWTSWLAASRAETRFAVERSSSGFRDVVHYNGTDHPTGRTKLHLPSNFVSNDQLRREVLEHFGPAAIVRFKPDALAAPSALVPDAQIASFYESGGHGLPGVYMSILGRGDASITTIKQRVRDRFVGIVDFRVVAESDSRFRMDVTLTGNRTLPLAAMSEGLRYFLAYSAIPFIPPLKILLVEEPENGLHPARIAEVIGVLREVSEAGTQVVMATHSPLVVNELRANEVTVVTRTAEHGTKVTPLENTPNFAERSQVYELGELWLSYANGKDEAPLLADVK